MDWQNEGEFLMGTFDAEVIRQYIKTQIIANMNTSVLPNIVGVGDTYMSEILKFGYVGVELLHILEEQQGSMNKQQTIHYGISVTTDSIVSLSDAYAQRTANTDDSNGNGVAVILRYLGKMGGLCSNSYIEDILYFSNVSEAQKNPATQFLATAAITFTVISISR
jgi:hypothetical protein